MLNYIFRHQRFTLSFFGINVRLLFPFECDIRCDITLLPRKIYAVMEFITSWMCFSSFSAVRLNVKITALDKC